MLKVKGDGYVGESETLAELFFFSFFKIKFSLKYNTHIEKYTSPGRVLKEIFEVSNLTTNLKSLRAHAKTRVINSWKDILLDTHETSH